MLKKITIGLLVIFAITAASVTLYFVLNIGDSSSNSDTDSSNSDSGSTTQSEAIDGGFSLFSRDEVNNFSDTACDLLTIKDIQAITVTEISEDAILVTDFLGCAYDWDKSNIAEIEVINENVIANSGGDLDYISENSISESNTIVLIVDDFYYYDTQEAVEKSFRTYTNELTEDEQGMLVEDIDNTIAESDELGTQIEEETGETIIDGAVDNLFSGSYEAVAGVGTKAAWSEEKKEMVIMYNNLIFTIEVNVEGDIDAYDTAIEIANNVIDRI